MSFLEMDSRSIDSAFEMLVKQSPVPMLRQPDANFQSGLEKISSPLNSSRINTAVPASKLFQHMKNMSKTGQAEQTAKKPLPSKSAAATVIEVNREMDAKDGDDQTLDNISPVKRLFDEATPEQDTPVQEKLPEGSKADDVTEEKTAAVSIEQQVEEDKDDAISVDTSVEKAIESNETDATTAASSEHVLSNWTIRPLKSGDICVEGDKQSEDGGLWHSTAIARRLSSLKLATASGSIYVLQGDIDEETAVYYGISPVLIEQFKHGFPKNWKELWQSQSRLSGESNKADGTSKRKKQDSKTENKTEQKENNKVKGPGRRPKSLQNKKERFKQETPFFKNDVTEPIDLTNLPATRSGRKVVPPLSWWTGQRIFINEKFNCSYIEQGTPNALLGTDAQVVREDKREKQRLKRLVSSTQQKRKRSGANKGSYIDSSTDVVQNETETEEERNLAPGGVGNEGTPTEVAEPRRTRKGNKLDKASARELGNKDVESRSSRRGSCHGTQSKSTLITAKPKMKGRQTRRNEAADLRQEVEESGGAKVRRGNSSPVEPRRRSSDRLRAKRRSSDSIPPLRSAGRGRKLVVSEPRKPVSRRAKSRAVSDSDTGVSESDLTPKMKLAKKLATRQSASQPRSKANSKVGKRQKNSRGAAVRNLQSDSNVEEIQCDTERIDSNSEDDCCDGDSADYLFVSDYESKQNPAVNSIVNEDNVLTKSLLQEKDCLQSDILGMLHHRKKVQLDSRTKSTSAFNELRTPHVNIPNIVQTKNHSDKYYLKKALTKNLSPATQERIINDSPVVAVDKNGGSHEAKKQPRTHSSDCNSLRERDNSSSDEDYDPKTKPRKPRKAVRKSNKSKPGKQSDDNYKKAGNQMKTGDEKNVTMAENKGRSSRKDAWTQEEVDKLNKAVSDIPRHMAEFWDLVAFVVKTKSAEECRKYQQLQATSAGAKTSKQQNKTVLSGNTISGGVGTLKRKRQLRELVENHNRGHDDDLFDSTPYKKRSRSDKNNANYESDSEFFQSHLTRLQTPGVKTPGGWMPTSSCKKTPGMFFSPGILKSVDRNEADQYLNRFKGKRRFQTGIRFKESSVKVRDHAVTSQNGVNTALFTLAEEGELENEEEQDYYFSDCD